MNASNSLIPQQGFCLAPYNNENHPLRLAFSTVRLFFTIQGANLMGSPTPSPA